jgi:hypothetical protein
MGVLETPPASGVGPEAGQIETQQQYSMNSTRLWHRFKPGGRADRIVNLARQRFLRLAPTARPATQPHNILTLFSQPELWELASAHRWPLPQPDLHFITGRRPERASCAATEGR